MKKLCRLVFLIQGIVCATAFAAHTPSDYDGSVSLPVNVQVVDGTKFDISGVYDFGKDNLMGRGKVLTTTPVKFKAQLGNTATEGAQFSIPKTVELTDSNNRTITVALAFGKDGKNTGAIDDVDKANHWRLQVDGKKEAFELETIGKLTLTGKEEAGDYTGTAKVMARVR